MNPFLTILLAGVFSAATLASATEPAPTADPASTSFDAALPGGTADAPTPDSPSADAALQTPTTAPVNSNQSPATVSLKSLPPGTIFSVQLGAFSSRERAFALYWDLSRTISPLQVVAPSGADALYRVRFGSYPNYQEAKAAALKLQKKGVDCFVTAVDSSGASVNLTQAL